MIFDKWLKTYNNITQYTNDIDALLVSIKVFQLLRTVKEAKSIAKLMKNRSPKFPLCNNAANQGVCCDDCIVYRSTDETCKKYIDLILGKNPLVGVELFSEILQWIETVANQ